MASYKIAFVGTGDRSICYARPYAQVDDIDVVALADPSAEQRRALLEASGLGSVKHEYDDFRKLLERHTDLDGVVICSPNHLHAKHAIEFLRRGLAVALEKPLATTPRDCEAILRAEREGGGRALVGFVLRSTPFYSRIHQLLADGLIGRITSIQADELVHVGVTSIMNRNIWRRYTERSGGTMLEKCCHDMDILNWMTGSRPAALASFGGRLIFGANPLLPDRCDGCPVGDSCHYCKEPRRSARDGEGGQFPAKSIREDECCIYNVDKDIVDTQSVTIEYENETVANFTLNFHCMGPRAGRNFHAVGTRGRVWGSIDASKVWHHDNATDTTTEYDTSGDGSGHGGGDRTHVMQLREMMADRSFRPQANAKMGYLSAMMSFATDQARMRRRVVHFRYLGNDRIEFD